MRKTFINCLSFISIISILTSCGIFRKGQNQQQTFTNPLLPRGADPWNIYKDGFYYYTQTVGDRIEIWKTKNISELNTAPHKTVWRPPSGTAWSGA